MNFFKHFGGPITPGRLGKYRLSPQWKNGRFQNLEETSMAVKLADVPRLLVRQLSNRKEREPQGNLPVLSLDKAAFLGHSDESRYVWYGHSVILMRLQGKTLLIDPMLGPDTTPIAPMTTKRFSKDTLSLIDNFPEIDLLLLTHDHYDHLDYASIQKLKSKTRQFFVALGVKRHLVHWGVAPERITEFDWWDSHSIEELTITFTPTRHFSGRGLTDRQKSLWGGWVFQTPDEKIWFSGDGGYGAHFKEIGRRLGPFDFAFLECGQYNEDWRPVHLFPDESVQAAIDAGAQKIMPVHWAAFALSYYHTWKEPAEEFVRIADLSQVAVGTPRLGQVFTIKEVGMETWWREFE